MGDAAASPGFGDKPGWSQSLIQTLLYPRDSERENSLSPDTVNSKKTPTNPPHFRHCVSHFAKRDEKRALPPEHELMLTFSLGSGPRLNHC